MRKSGLIALIVVGVLVVILLMCGVGGISSYNSLVTKKQEIDARWSEVQNQMQRRADLIPNIVGTVKGVAGLEERVFTKIAEARSNLLSTSMTASTSSG